jgi:hypothetical protein
VWNEDLAMIAQSHAERCEFQINTARHNQLSGYSNIGENILTSDDFTEYRELISSNWLRESTYYNSTTGECSNACSQYTQVGNAVTSL